jgi:hypothetical protein
MASEESRAAMSRTRGEVAAGMSDQEAKKKFIARQGTEESKGKQDLSGLSEDAFRQRNVNVAGSFKHGGTVPKTGIYKLHKDEKVIPAVEVSPDYKRSSPGAKEFDQKMAGVERQKVESGLVKGYMKHGPNENLIRAGSSAIAEHDKDK